MKKLGYALLVVAGLAAVAVAQKMDKPTIVTAADMKWTPVPGTTAQMANLVGDWQKGAHTVEAKLSAGEDHPLHTHAATLKTTVISGTFWIAGEGEKPKMMGPGSFAIVPAGWKHTSGCDKAAPCVIFQEGDGAFDMKPVAAAAKTPAKK